MIEKRFITDMTFEDDSVIILTRNRDYLKSSKEMVTDKNITEEPFVLNENNIQDDGEEYYKSPNYDYVSNLLSSDSDYRNQIKELK